MDELIENEVRERVCEDNQKRMRTVKRNFAKTRVYNFYLGIPLSLISWILLINWMLNTGTAMRKAIKMMAEDPEPAIFPWYAVTAFLVPLITLFTFLTQSNPKRIFNILAMLLHFVIVLFAVSNLFLGFEHMRTSDMIFLGIYGFLGMWSQDYALRSYKELDYLMTQEGYPDFNFNLEKDRYSRFVKYRNSWLKKSKKLDYFPDTERPLEKAVQVKTENEHSMDGIAVLESDSADWHESNTAVMGNITAPEESSMGGLETSGEGAVFEEEYDDPRRRPL